MSNEINLSSRSQINCMTAYHMTFVCVAFFIPRSLLRKIKGEVALATGKMYKRGTFGVIYRK